MYLFYLCCQTEQLEEEKAKREKETSSLSTQLTEKMKESAEFKQKWEDEIDANKTWKRKHANNVKVGKVHVDVV